MNHLCYYVKVTELAVFSLLKCTHISSLNFKNKSMWRNYWRHYFIVCLLVLFLPLLLALVQKQQMNKSTRKDSLTCTINSVTPDPWSPSQQIELCHSSAGSELYSCTVWTTCPSSLQHRDECHFYLVNFFSLFLTLIYLCTGIFF